MQETPAQAEREAEKEAEEGKNDSSGLFRKVLTEDILAAEDARDAMGDYPAALELHGLRHGGPTGAKLIYEKAIVGDGHDAVADEGGVPIPRDWNLSGQGQRGFLRLMRRAAGPVLQAMNKERGVSGPLVWLTPWRFWRRATFAQAMREGLRPAEILLRAFAGAGVFSSPFNEWSKRDPAFDRRRRTAISDALVKINSAIAWLKSPAPRGGGLASLRLPQIPMDEGILEFLPVEVIEHAADTEKLDPAARDRARRSLRHAGAFHWDGKIFVLGDVLRAASDRQAAAIILHEWLAMQTGLPHEEKTKKRPDEERLDVVRLMERITARAFGEAVRDQHLQSLLKRLKAPASSGVWGSRLRNPEWVARAVGWTLALGAPLFGIASFATGVWPAAGWAALSVTGVLLGFAGYEVGWLAAGYKARGGQMLEEAMVGLAGLFFAVAAIFAGFLLMVYAAAQVLLKLSVPG